VFGPLPRVYRLGLVVASVAFFVVVGAWVAQATPVLVPPWGSLVGAAAGGLAAFLLVHDFARRSGRPRAPHRP
jgi:hypothetical protein